MKRLLCLLALLAAALSATAQSFTNNPGNLSLIFYASNLPPAMLVDLENVWRLHGQMCTTNTASKLYTPTYRYQTNYVQSGVDTNGQPVFSQTVTTNTAWTRQQMLSHIVSPDSTRVQSNLREILSEWLADRRARMATERLKE